MKNVKSPGKRILKWFLVTLLSLLVVVMIGVAVVLNFILTPSKLTPMVEKTAKEYLNAEVRFGEIELTFFSTFPELGLKMTDVTVISGVFRGADSTVMRASDSLMTVNSCLLTIDPLAYLRKNRIEIKEFRIDRPQIYAYVNPAGIANWDIVKPSDDTLAVDTTALADTTVFDSRIKIQDVRIENGDLIFDDRSTQLYTQITGLNLDLDGFLGKRRSRLNVSLATQNILFWQEGKLLVNHLALGVKTGMHVRRDSLLYTLDKAVFDVNGVKFGVSGKLQGDTVNRVLKVDLKYGIHIPSLKTLLDLVPDTILKKTEDVDVRGEVLCRGEVKGLYGRENIPLLTSEFKIKDGYVKYPGMPSQIDTLNVDFDALVDLQKDQSSYIQLKHLCVKGGGLDVDCEGKVEELLTAPQVKAKIDALIDFAELTKIFPLADGITCKGHTDLSLTTDVLVEDVIDANYGKLKIGGWCRMNRIAIFIPKDSIVMKVKSAGMAFATNRKDSRILQGKDLLNGIIGYSGLDVHFRKRIRLLMDTTYLTFRTSPLKDTSAIASVNSTLRLGKTVFIVRDTLLLGLKEARAKASLLPFERNKKIPKIHAELKVDSLRLRALGNRLYMVKADVLLDAVRSKRNTKIWFPSGYVDFTGLRAYTPYFPLRMRMPGTKIRFNMNEVSLDSAVLQLGRSNLRMTGQIDNLARSFFRKDTLIAKLNVESSMVDCNQLMHALDAGTAYAAKVAAGYREVVTDDSVDIEELPVVTDSIVYEGNNSIFIVPPGIDFTFQTNIDKILFGNLVMDSIHGEVVMRNQCIQLSDLELRSSAANMKTSLLYKATDTIKAYAGFSLQMDKIRIDSLVHLMPSLDTLFPMLRSFEGLVDFHMAADARLDSTMMIDLPTLRAAAYLDGQDLVLMDGETFAEISKMLMFKNKKRNMIDSISLDIQVKDGTIEIFPFLLEIDRYKAAIGGEHNIDMTFKYHVSILKSPLPFRAGVDISGTLDKMKIRVTKAKYKNLFIPSRKAKVDSTQLNLKKRMREMLRSVGSSASS